MNDHLKLSVFVFALLCLLLMRFLILGRGNAAFEVANHISGYANHVHLLGRSRVRLSWSTHYVGDLR